jgi:signal transduction histidine kinase
MAISTKDIKRYLKSQFDIASQAKEIGVPVWRAPSVLFVFLGGVIMVLMYIVYASSKMQEDPIFLIAAEFFVAMVTLLIGGIIIHSVEQIARVNKMKSEFISIASHQMKTPLSQIKWTIDSIHFSNIEEKSQYESKIFNIRRANEAMISLVNDLLDVARVEKGETIIHPEETNLIPILDGVLESYRMESESRNISLKFENALKDVPTACVDKRRLRVALENLIGNAISYTKSGGEVSVSLENNGGGYLKISVKDTGIGIPESEQPYIFQRFFRAKNAKRHSTSGTGLGLYLTKNIIEQSGGEIQFRSIEGAGTLFSITLPVHCEYKKKQLKLTK